MGSSEDHAYRLLNDYANGFMVSQVLFAACELGVFDLLAEAPGPLDVAAVAAGVGASAHGTELLLDICVSLKLLKVETRGGKASYRNTELSSDYLTTVSPTSQCSMLKYMGRTSYRCWGHLADAVREGRNQYLETFGVPAEELFTAIYRSDGERLQFMQALQEVWSVNGRSVLTAFDLSVFPLMCDLGGTWIKLETIILSKLSQGQKTKHRVFSLIGGAGALAKECMSLYPGCKITVFDIPEVVWTAKQHFSFQEEEHIDFQEGDFFKDPLPEADLYILARVLHDWADGKCSHLLERIYHTCKPGGGILVIESLLDEDRRGPLLTQLYSLNMLVQTEGQERTPTQYHMLLSSAGFRDFQFKKTGAIYDAILARK
ncbi:ASMT isoform 3 [Pan troglodytes]|uniref:Acetylserotonin O-methyltransferase n=2 Tax=Pan troglodytes TaxID=9598 RepID=A0A6D2XFY9_PANTR|nr:acetylserotonin O-methyltransferase isoform X3 [Pan troglodytes]XP_054533186.1 acetylserotonin O-methyltransferase isoform X3 [Pan troglodytes]PNI11675.1 ASMT isoform 3 [Pan troglodytes]